MLSLAAFDYHLPPEQIAQTPVSPRDHSRLLILDRHKGSVRDARFYDLATLLTQNDVLVVNDTKVFPARLFVRRLDSNATKPVEILLEKEVSVTPDSISWEALTKPGLKPGDRFHIPGSHVTGVCSEIRDYTRVLTFNLHREHFFAFLSKWAKTPIPPYIRWNSDDEPKLRELYQTVYAARVGAVAAPTAGLHFTPKLLDSLRNKGVQVETVTLHVGAGTFLPVKTDDITRHHMHGEWYELNQPTASALMDAKTAGKRLIAVGTTTVRVLETTKLVPSTGTTNIFIYPPYKFTVVDSLITNFHTPKSTLLMLISAFVSSPNTHTSFTDFSTSTVGTAYEHAMKNGYRFYSFGDAMWIK